MRFFPGWDVAFRLADGLADLVAPPWERRGLEEELEGL